MRSKSVLLAFCILLIGNTISVLAQKNSKILDAMIADGMRQWEIPGLVTTVIQDGEVVFSKAYGVKNLETQSPVDRKTLFNMGSTTKAVVSLALGILVDRGQLNWNDKVYKHLPEFQLSDPYIREEARVKDLLTHNLGIDEADLLWALDSTSTAETIARFAGAKKTFPVRGGFVYNNLMYAVAGEVIKAASGKHWADFVTEEILMPLQMENTVARASDMVKRDNRAIPYVNLPKLGLQKASYDLSDQIGAAGMIYTCLEDVEHYMIMLEAGGVYNGKTLISPENFAYIFEPQTLIDKGPFYPTQQLTKPHWRSYGLGWFQHDYRGEKLDFHTGSITGLIAIAGIIHDKNTAVYVMANLDHAELRHAILYKAMDLWAFNDNSRDWNAEIFELYAGFKELAKNQEDQLQADRIEGTKTRLAFEAYAGTYSHPMYGNAAITASEEGLTLNFNNFAAFQLQHWHHDTFRSDTNNRYLTELMVNFNFGPDGAVSELEAMGQSFQKKNE
jgi:CubicO group peptidase (beta-lactamase class C family)